MSGSVDYCNQTIEEETSVALGLGPWHTVGPFGPLGREVEGDYNVVSG